MERTRRHDSGRTLCGRWKPRPRHGLKSWLPKLHYPIRVGEHDQTAFSFGLVWDWAGVAGDSQMRAALADAGRRFYLGDHNCPLAYEPSGEDFLSPCLAEADFMRRVLDASAFGKWLTGFLPQIPTSTAVQWLPPGVVTDRADPKLAHLDGLNLSRAWMLEGIAHGLGPGRWTRTSTPGDGTPPSGGGAPRG